MQISSTKYKQIKFNQYIKRIDLRVNCSEVGNENSIQILQQSDKAILLNNEENQLKWISLLFYKKPGQLLAKKKVYSFIQK